MELIRHTPLDQTWLKAAVIGSLWASVEIVAGSFLHNLQIPFSGTILTAFAIFLLTAFSRLWQERGIIWRAGIICALMKSISPSGVIIGPMVGIITEAFLFEFTVILLGRNIIGLGLGGGFAALSAILHKFFTLLILYGFDLLRILGSLYQYAIKQLNIPNTHPADLIWMLAAIYFLIGLVAVFLGYWAGNNFVKKEIPVTTGVALHISQGNNMFGRSKSQNYSTPLIFVHLLVLTGILWLLNLNIDFTALALSLFYLGFCLYRYPSALGRLKKIAIWIQFLLIVVTAIFIWDILKMEDTGVESGWIMGLKMVGRAIVLIIGFASISVELKNPLVKTVLYNRGLANLYQALTLTFGVLPDLVTSLSISKGGVINPVNLIEHLLRTAKELIRFFEVEIYRLPKIFIITGDVGEGKTTYANSLLLLLKERGIKFSGFLSVATIKNSQRTGFILEDLDSGATAILCETSFHEGWIQTGRYYFSPDAFEFGNMILDPIMLKDSQLVVIDELGSLELNNKGWSCAIERLSSKLSTPQVWIVRKSLLGEITRRWSVGDIFIFDVAKDEVTEMEKTILSQLEIMSNSLSPVAQ